MPPEAHSVRIDSLNDTRAGWGAFGLDCVWGSCFGLRDVALFWDASADAREGSRLYREI